MFSSFFLPFRGLRWVFKPGLKKFVLVPLIVNTLLISLTIWLSAVYFDAYMDRLLPEEGWLSYLRWLLWSLFALAYAIGVFYGFTIIANLIGAPFNALLAARVEELRTGTRVADTDIPPLQLVVQSIAGELSKIAYLATRAIPILLLFLIPGLNALAPALWAILGFWFLALEYGDYPMGNHDLAPKDQRRILKADRLSALSFGAGATVLMLIPILNFAAMPASVIGATHLWTDRLSTRQPRKTLAAENS